MRRLDSGPLPVDIVLANLAPRMQAVATTGSIAITEHTRRLVEGYFAVHSRAPTRVKGVVEPVNVYEVMGPGPLRTKLDVPPAGVRSGDRTKCATTYRTKRQHPDRILHQADQDKDDADGRNVPGHRADQRDARGI